MTKMNTLGRDFLPPGIHAGGLCYHEKLLEAVAVPQLATFEAGVPFARNERINPAPKACHAFRAEFDEAPACQDCEESRVIQFNLTGDGHFDMATFDRLLAGELENYAYPAEATAESLAHAPKVG